MSHIITPPQLYLCQWMCVCERGSAWEVHWCGGLAARCLGKALFPALTHRCQLCAIPEPWVMRRLAPALGEKLIQTNTVRQTRPVPDNRFSSWALPSCGLAKATAHAAFFIHCFKAFFRSRRGWQGLPFLGLLVRTLPLSNLRSSRLKLKRQISRAELAAKARLMKMKARQIAEHLRLRKWSEELGGGAWQLIS